MTKNVQWGKGGRVEERERVVSQNGKRDGNFPTLSLFIGETQKETLQPTIKPRFINT